MSDHYPSVNKSQITEIANTHESRITKRTTGIKNALHFLTHLTQCITLRITETCDCTWFSETLERTNKLTKHEEIALIKEIQIDNESFE